EVRIEAVEPAELALRRGDPRIVVEVESIRRRRREHHLPVERRAVRRILRQQPVQQRGSGARQSGDEERPAHRLRGDLGRAAAIPPQAEPVRQQADPILPRGDAAEEAEPRLAVEVRDQALQWLVEPGIAEVVEAGPLPGLLEKELAVEAHEREARTLNDPAAAPECARQRAAVGAHALRACRRRPSSVAATSSCQAIRPGTPRSSSRTRLVSDRASAISGLSPSTRPRLAHPPSSTPSAPGRATAPARTACPRLSSITADDRLTGWPRKESASHTSPTPTIQLTRCHALALAIVRRCR